MSYVFCRWDISALSSLWSSWSYLYRVTVAKLREWLVDSSQEPFRNRNEITNSHRERPRKEHGQHQLAPERSQSTRQRNLHLWTIFRLPQTSEIARIFRSAILSSTRIGREACDRRRIWRVAVTNDGIGRDRWRVRRKGQDCSDQGRTRTSSPGLETFLSSCTRQFWSVSPSKRYEVRWSSSYARKPVSLTDLILKSDPSERLTPISFPNSDPTSQPPLPITRLRRLRWACTLAPALSKPISFLLSKRFLVLLAIPQLSNPITVLSLLSQLALRIRCPPLLLHRTPSTSRQLPKISDLDSLLLNQPWVTQFLILPQASRLLPLRWQKLERRKLEREVLRQVNFVRGLLQSRNRLLPLKSEVVLPMSTTWLLFLLQLLLLKLRLRGQLHLRCLDPYHLMKQDGMVSVVIHRLVKEEQEGMKGFRRMEKETMKRGGQTMRQRGF